MRLIYLSPVPWNSFSQRPHELIRYFHARTGGEVLWIDPYPTRLPALSDLFNKRPTSASAGDMTPRWINVVKPTALPVEPLPFSGNLNKMLWRPVLMEAERFADGSTMLGIGKPSELALTLLAHKKFACSFYDAMDDFPSFYTGWSRRAMSRRELMVLRGVTTVLASSSALRQRLAHLSEDVRLVLNACASDRLPATPIARDRDFASPPTIGYVGTIAQWFDWGLLLALAGARPDAKFRLIGPLYGQVPSALPRNVVLEPPLPHNNALIAMMQFDVGLIPFKKTSLTSSVDPIKYYEYRALGVPILSSNFGEMKLRGKKDGVWLVDHDSDLKAAIDQALASRTTEAEIASFRHSNSWEKRFDQAGIFS
ncbi:glycosyltransferase family 1 protein [Noviherbaspirillum sp. UKPF54]|uniref:glycosyltransferase family 1 protein n=1 Tax=Noviherbaspirillum sp. UKPF54 TaxID=2601898 RepID=UPI0011B1A606|nr:glycosyltransferase family 1 protein [Noviherbaspirillum sp. UKPF54]QDZ28845.1 glycosyltransferase family 1 protein [Noviherbaspirillum sp. UKPF54]